MRKALLFLLLLPTTVSAVESGVVKITTNTGQGTGFVIADGYVLTCAHCVTSNMLSDGSPAQLVAIDRGDDVALIRTNTIGSPFTLGAGGGTGTRCGYPSNRYSEDTVTVSSSGAMSRQAFPGASGGPVASGRTAFGMVKTVTHAVTADVLRAFLESNGYGHILVRQFARPAPARPLKQDRFEWRTPTAPTSPYSAPPPDSRDEDLAEINRLCWEIAQEVHRLEREMRQRRLQNERWIYVVPVDP